MSTIPEARSAARDGGSRRGPVVIRVAALDAIAPMDVAEAFRDLPGLALLESARPGRMGRWSFLTADPVAVLEAPTEGPDPFVEARALLGRLDAAPAGPAPDSAHPAADPVGLAADSGRFGAGGLLADAGPELPRPPFTGGLVGYLAYDLARRFERLPSLARVDQHLPLLRLALHDWTLAWDRRSGTAWLAGRAVDGDHDGLRDRLGAVLARVDALGRGEMAPSPRHRPAAGAAPTGTGSTGDVPLRFASGTAHRDWLDAVQAVRAAIERGEVYQANLTRRLEAPFAGDPWPLYRRLRTGDPALFAGFLDLGPSPATGAPRAILSASPEPFLAVSDGGLVSTDPIKGTRPRGRTRETDRVLARELIASGKDRAENVMIVDVLRNDLGRVCVPGTVRVPRLLRLERTATVQHLVTTVTGRLRPGLGPFDLLASSFPGGSITGAPKIRAMQLIESLEPVRRGPYCGTLAWIGPDGRMGSSILIRTFVADGERLTLHVGGGITWQSDPAQEWDETVAKARGPLSSLGAVESGSSARPDHDRVRAVMEAQP